MIRKLAVAAVASAFLASPALAARRGLPDTAACTHCLPSPLTGGQATVHRGRVVSPARPEAAVATGARPQSSRLTTTRPARPAGRVAVAAECGCATGACPVRG